MEMLQENIQNNGKKNFNGIVKPILMGCYQKEAQSIQWHI
jgi:hypothetical protein